MPLKVQLHNPAASAEPSFFCRPHLLPLPSCMSLPFFLVSLVLLKVLFFFFPAMIQLAFRVKGKKNAVLGFNAIVPRTDI